MTTETTLAHAFAALEQTVPDTDTAFADLTTRLDGLGRKRAHRAAGGGLAVAAVAGLAVTVSLSLSGGTADQPTRAGTAAAPPAIHHTTPAPVPALRQVAFSTRLTTSTGIDGVTRPVVTVDAGWLPAGATLQGATADDYPGNGGSKGWTVPYPDGTLGRDGRPGTYQVSVAIYGLDGLPPRFMSAGGTDLTVAGRPARLFTVNFNTVIYLDLGRGQVAQALVFSDPADLSPADALATAKHLADQLEYGQHETLPVTAVLTAAPTGDTIVSAYSDLSPDYPSTYYKLNRDNGGAEVGIGAMAEKYPAPLEGTPGRDVQGKPSLVIHDRGRTILYIKGLYGEFTKVFSGTGAETLADLYQIADGIRAVG